MDIGTEIKIARTRKGLTQKQLGEKIHLSAVTIGKIENNQTDPTIGNILRIAEALGVDVKSFFN